MPGLRDSPKVMYTFSSGVVIHSCAKKPIWSAFSPRSSGTPHREQPGPSAKNKKTNSDELPVTQSKWLPIVASLAVILSLITLISPIYRVEIDKDVESASDPISQLPRAADLTFANVNASLVESTLNDSKISELVTIMEQVTATIENCSLARLYLADSASLTLINSSVSSLAQLYERATVTFINCTMGTSSTIEGGGDVDFEAVNSTFNILRLIGESSGSITNCTITTLDYAVRFKASGSISGNSVTGDHASNLVITSSSISNRGFQVRVGETFTLDVASARIYGLNASGSSVVRVVDSEVGGVTAGEDFAQITLERCALTDRVFAWYQSSVQILDCNRKTPDTVVWIYAYQNCQLYIREGHFGYLYCLGTSNTTLVSVIFDHHCFAFDATINVDKDSSVGEDVCYPEDGGEPVDWTMFYLALTIIVIVVGLGSITWHEVKNRRQRRRRWASAEETPSGKHKVRAVEKSQFMKTTRRTLAPSCPRCGEPMDAGPTNYCTRCDRHYCAACSRPLRNENAPCPSCGHEPGEIRQDR